MKLIELCRYTLKQSLYDDGDYSQYMNAEELLKNLNNI